MPLKEGEANEEEEAPLSGAIEERTISHETAEGEGETDTCGLNGGADDNVDDEELFKPPPPKEECALCFVPSPTRANEMGYYSCCGKIICIGCVWKHRQVLATTNAKRALKDPPEPPLEKSCAFCRAPSVLETYEEIIQRVEARMDLGDPKAFGLLASYYATGMYGLPRDVRKAFEFRLRAAELGSADAFYNVSCMYSEGHGVERDDSKEAHYLKLAAKKGHIMARHNLGCVEGNRGNDVIAVRHWMISASAGDDDSQKNIGIAYRKKHATKDQFEEAIRAKHAAKKEMQSEERNKARAVRAAGLL